MDAAGPSGDAAPQQPKGWRDLHVAWRPLADLIPSARNARTHSPEQVDQIAASILEFGWTNPVLVDEAGEIIAGHGRGLAGQKLGGELAPTIMLAGLSPEQKTAYRVADNKLALNAGWNNELLIAELQTLTGAIDLAAMGFSQVELESLLAPDSDPHAEWAGQGMPGHEQDADKPFFSIMVHFKNEAAVHEFSRLVEQHINVNLRRMHFLWFPKQEDITVEAGE